MSLRSMFSYAVLGSVSVQTLITLASTSGLMAHALGLDDGEVLEAPATGALTATFSFRPAPTPTSCYITATGRSRSTRSSSVAAPAMTSCSC
jgi:hypothetical protein